MKLILNLDESLRAQNLGNLKREFLGTKYYKSTIYFLNKVQLVVSSDSDNLENIYNHQTSARTIHRPTYKNSILELIIRSVLYAALL